MLSIILLTAAIYLIYYIYCLISNIRFARSTGLPYIVVPFNVFSVFWMLTGRRIYPLLAKLPFLPRLRWIRPDWFWYRGYEIYREVKSDVFFAVSASGVFLMVGDADVAQDMLNRKDDFPKPPGVYPALDIYGRNLVTASGAEWKMHRRIINPHFGENYNKLAWTKGREVTNLLVKSWTRQLPGESNGPLITSSWDDCRRLTLTVTFNNMFGLPREWPNRKSSGYHNLSTEEGIPAGHTMSFQSCVHHFFEYCNIVLVSPSWYLKYSPVKAHRKAGEAHRELDLYMHEMLQKKREEIQNGAAKGHDLISALIHAQEPREKPLEGDRDREQALTEQDVIGNIFGLIFTGHVTTTVASHYSIMLLALYPKYQIKLQEDLDRILGDREPDYERDFQALSEGWAGAILYEVLRLYPSVPLLPKFTYSPQYITYNDTKYLLPQHTPVILNTSNIQRNPKYWVKPHETEQEAALNEFRPERWFTNATSNEDLPKSFFRPYKGSYFPWSDGQRVCLGKKYTVVELIGVYVEIFRRWSVELDVPEGQTVEDVRRRTKEYVENAEIVLALQPKGKEPGIRCVRRGEERYFPRRE